MADKLPLIAVIATVVLVLAILITLGLAVLDLRHDATVRLLWTWAGRLWTGLCGIIPILMVVSMLAAIPIALRYASRKAAIHAALVYQRGGQLPASAHPNVRLVDEYYDPRVATPRAIFAGPDHPNATSARLSASVVRQLLNPSRPDEAVLPDAGPPSVPLEDALRVNPHNPHWLLIGGTGYGKSVATFTILERICRQARAEVLICERDGVNWNRLAATDTIGGYIEALRAVEVERQRRVDLLRDADVAHINLLTDPPPYLVMLVEEAESIYSDLKRYDRRTSQEFVLLLRGIASMGRKQGIMLIASTQTGTSEVFDVPTRKQFGHRFIFNSEPTVGDAWGLPRSVGLPTLPPGTAYDLSHNGLVQFPLVARPELLPMSSIYRNNSHDQLLLPADAAADGLGAADQPDGVPVSVPVPRTYGDQQAEECVVPVPVSVPPSLAAQPGLPDDAMIDTIFRIWKATGRNINQTQQAVFKLADDNHGGMPWLICSYAINTRLGHRHYAKHSHEYDDWLSRQPGRLA